MLYVSVGHFRSIEAVEDVVADTRREEARLLLNDGELGLVVPLGVDFLDVFLVEESLAGDRVVKALNQGNN